MLIEDARLLCWATCDIDMHCRDLMSIEDARLLCWATCDIDM